MTRRIRLSTCELESRITPAVKVLFDFRYDNGFFTDHPDRINVLRAAADDVSSRFSDQLAAIPYPAAGDSWKAIFDAPEPLGSEVEILNLLVPADTIVVFVGARELIGNLLEVSSARSVSGSTEWSNLVNGRGQANSFGPNAVDFSPWGGSLTFDLINNWHFGLEPPGNSNEFDLYMVAQNGIMHLLGFGASEAFSKLSTTGSFTGPLTSSLFGAPVPLSSGRFEWVEDTLSAPNAARTLMDEEFEDGERVALTQLDLLAMQDIGWQIGTSPPPPAVPMPPTIPPTVIPAGYRLVAFGAGEGVGPESAVTLNEAQTLTEAARFNPFESGFTGGTRTVTADINGDSVEDIILGPGPGRSTEVRIYSGANVAVNPNGALLRVLAAFESSFKGGVFTSVGDLTGDGVPDIAISPDEGGGPRVRVYDGKSFEQLNDFFGIDDPNFRGGARTAIGDLNGDGFADLVVAAGFGGGPRIAGYDGKSVRPGQVPTNLFGDFFIFEDTLRNGAYVAVGDLNADGKADLIAGGGPSGGPRVFALSGADLTNGNKQTQLANFFAGDENNRGGVRIGVEDADRDGRADILAGAGTDAQPLVTMYLGSQIEVNGTPPVFLQYRIFDVDFDGGVFVG